MSSDPRDEIVEHLPSLRAFAMSLSRNSATADDMVQDTVVKAWTNIDKFQPGTNMRAWLFTILRNTYYSLHRKRGREIADGRLAMSDFRDAFAKLPDEQREALVLVGASGFSYEEAAEMCGCAVGTIKSRANRGRKRLAELLELDETDSMELTDSATMGVVNASPTG
jgi:RNA polymerase sigma-70 factor (ECF subfamily)